MVTSHNEHIHYYNLEHIHYYKLKYYHKRNLTVSCKIISNYLDLGIHFQNLSQKYIGKYKRMYIHCSTVDNGKGMETTQMLTNRKLVLSCC